MILRVSLQENESEHLLASTCLHFSSALLAAIRREQWAALGQVEPNPDASMRLTKEVARYFLAHLPLPELG